MISKLIRIIIFVISLLDKFERDDIKLIKSFNIEGVKVKTDTGYKPLSHIHLTKSFQVYKLKLKNGLELECADTHIVFDKNMNEVFVKDLNIGDYIQTEEGLVQVIDIYTKPYKLCMCDVTVDDENHRFYSNGILSHNTTTSAIFMLWYSLFNTDKNALVLGNKRKTAEEILKKVKDIFIEIPYFLKPGIRKWNEGEIVFDNGCRIMAEATTINSGIGFTFHCVLADEFAHIPSNILESFYNNIFPTITAGRSKFIITSTQNGYNLFYRLYKAAEAGLNDYKPFKTDWYEVPEWNPDKKCWERRDELWHQRQVANYGSEEAFNKQFGTNFDINSNTLISIKKLKESRSNVIEFVEKDLYGVSYSNRYTWNPNFDPMEDLKNSSIVVTIDISEGVQGDYTTFCFNKLYPDRDECIGIFHANDLNIEACTRSLQELCIKYCNPDRLLISLETNLYGELFIKQLLNNQELDEFSKFDESTIIKYYNDNMSKYTYGIRVTRGNKTLSCNLFKDQYEKGQIVNNSTLFINELENFCDNTGNNTYQASFGHDDVVMAQIQLVLAQQTLQYKNLRAELDSAEDQNNASNYNPYDMSNSGRGILNMDDIYDILKQESTCTSNLNRLTNYGG